MKYLVVDFKGKIVGNASDSYDLHDMIDKLGKIEEEGRFEIIKTKIVEAGSRTEALGE